MTGEADASAERRRTEWARTTLGVAADSDRNARRSAFLRALTENDFEPDESLTEAWRLLDREAWKIDLHDAPSFLLDDFRRWELEVDAFASSLFQLEGDKRTAEFQRLWEGCHLHVTLRHRLRRLQPALQLTTDKLVSSDPFVSDLTCELCRLFTLRPSEAAVRRRERALEMLRGLDAAKWRTAAQVIRKSQPQLAALDGPLMSILSFGAPAPIRAGSPKRFGAAWTTERTIVLGAAVVVAMYVAFHGVAYYSDVQRQKDARESSSFIIPSLEGPSPRTKNSESKDPLSSDPSQEQVERLLRDLLENPSKNSKPEEPP